MARRNARGRGELLIADRANVLDLPQLRVFDLRERVDLFDRRATVDKRLPAVLRLQVDVEIRVQAHHARADFTSRLEHHRIRAVSEHDHAEDELDDVASGAHVVDVVVQLLPEHIVESVDHKKRVDG